MADSREGNGSEESEVRLPPGGAVQSAQERDEVGCACTTSSTAARRTEVPRRRIEQEGPIFSLGQGADASLSGIGDQA